MTTLLIVLSNAIGGSTFPATAVTLRGFPPRDALFVRMGVCTLLFAPVLWRARRRLAALSPRDWGLLAAVGLLGHALPLALGLVGQARSSAASASLLIGMEPVSIVALSCLFLGERLNGLRALSLSLGLSGALVIAFQGPPRLAGAFTDRMAGDLILASSGFCWALYTVIGKPTLRRVEPLDFTAVTTLFAFLGVAAWAAPGLSPAAWRAASPAPWLALLYLAAGGSFLGALLWNAALRDCEASRQANFIFLQPFVGVALSAGLLGEALGAWTLVGGALVLGGMWAATRGAA